MNIEISDDMWKRIEYHAKLRGMTPLEFVHYVLEHQVPHVPDPERARTDLARLQAEAGPEDDFDLDEFLQALETNRGRQSVSQPESNGVTR